MLIVSHRIATKTITKFNNITYLAKLSYLKNPNNYRGFHSIIH